jgi:putative DNA primase/helicase
MTYKNYEDVLQQLRAAHLDVKLPLRVDLGPDKFTRCKVEGQGNEARGWYKLFSLGDLLTGAFGIWSATDPQSFKVDLPKGERKQLTADQLAAIKAKQDTDRKRAEADRQREIEKASRQASHWWRQLADAGESGYMVKKGFDATDLFGARISQQGNLVVPVQDFAKKTYGLQVIYPSKSRKGRDKDFTPPGLAKKSHCFQIGIVQRGGIVLLCEGFATGASLRKATGLPVVVAFDAGNLTHVAIELHKAHRKDVRIMVCADDDYLTDAKLGKNPGIEAATTAALAVNGGVVWPKFPGERSTTEKGPTDFNDLHTHPDGGLRMVAAQVEEAIASAGWRAKPARAAALHTQGGGEYASGGAGDADAGDGKRRRAQAIMPLDDIIERFVPLDDGTGKYVFDTWTNKIALREQMVTLLPAGVRGDDIKRHPLYIARGAYYLDQVGFDPTGADPDVMLNTWQGWPIAPKEGECSELLNLLYYLCSGDPAADTIFHWLLCWMAWPLQHPGAKMSSAVIMHGPQGTGKSTVFQTLAKIYGNYSTVLNQRGLEDKFNSDWSDSKLFILAEEVVTRQEMWHIKNELKELVTGDWIRINPKNIAAYRQRNQLNIVYLSNENQPLPIENDDRRHLVVYTPPALDESTYDRVFLELENGGVEAFYNFLLNYDTTGFHPKKRPPMTEAKQALMALASPSETRFVVDWVGGDTNLPICPALAMDVYAAYLKWCRLNGESRPRPSNQFIGAVARLPGWEKIKARVYADYHCTGETTGKSLLIPPTQVLEAHKRAMPPGSSVMKWHTESALDFANAIKGEAEKWSNAA